MEIFYVPVELQALKFKDALLLQGTQTWAFLLQSLATLFEFVLDCSWLGRMLLGVSVPRSQLVMDRIGA